MMTRTVTVTESRRGPPAPRPGPGSRTHRGTVRVDAAGPTGAVPKFPKPGTVALPRRTPVRSSEPVADATVGLLLAGGRGMRLIMRREVRLGDGHRM